MYEEYKKDHLACITDDEVLETIAENKDKVVQKHSKSGIIVKGLYDVAVHFSKCCSPVPGDEIVGFVSRGRGVMIHRKDCPNMKNEEPERLLDAEWAGDTGSYTVAIRVVGGEKTPILIYVSNACTLLGLTITSVNGRLDPKTSQSIVDFTIKLNKKSDIDMLFAKVKQNAEIDDIYRIVT